MGKGHLPLKRKGNNIAKYVNAISENGIQMCGIRPAYERQ